MRCVAESGRRSESKSGSEPPFLSSFLVIVSGVSKRGDTSMSFLTRSAVAAFFMFALLSAARAQAPVQTSNQATAQPPDNDFYSVREPASPGDAHAQFALASHHLD